VRLHSIKVAELVATFPQDYLDGSDCGGDGKVAEEPEKYAA
jgi:hypothetical protein